MANKVVATAFGGPDVLSVVEADVPEPGPGEVAIAVKAAGVNLFDYKIISGGLGADPDRLPLPVGLEVAGVVTAVGDRTQYESAWYRCCITVLGWFLEAAGVARDRHPQLLEQAVGGRFASWTEPDDTLLASVAECLAGQVADA